MSEPKVFGVIKSNQSRTYTSTWPNPGYLELVDFDTISLRGLESQLRDWPGKESDVIIRDMDTNEVFDILTTEVGPSGSIEIIVRRAAVQADVRERDG